MVSNLRNEVWKDINGYEGFYQVSNLGRIKSLSRKVWTGKYLKNIEEKIKSNAYCKGYDCIHLYKNGEYKQFRINRLVAETFIPNPNNLPEVNHKDEDKINNKVDNLEWCTSKYNANYGTRNVRVAEKTRKKIIGVNLKDGSQLELSHSEVAKEYGLNPSAIRNNLIGLSKSSGGFRWQYA